VLTGSGWAVLVATALLLGAGAAAGYPELLVLGLDVGPSMSRL